MVTHYTICQCSQGYLGSRIYNRSQLHIHQNIMREETGKLCEMRVICKAQLGDSTSLLSLTMDQQPSYHLGACEKYRISGSSQTYQITTAFQQVIHNMQKCKKSRCFKKYPDNTVSQDISLQLLSQITLRNRKPKPNLCLKNVPFTEMSKETFRGTEDPHSNIRDKALNSLRIIFS